MWFVSHLRRACSPAWIARAVDWIPVRLRPCKSFFDWKRTHFDAFRPFGRKLIKWKRWLKISQGRLFLLTCIEFNWRHKVQFYRCRTSVESRKRIKTLVRTGIDAFLMETKTHPFENAFFLLSTGPKSLSSSVFCYHVQCGIVFFLFAVYLSIGNINFIFILDITSPVTMFHANLMPVITISKWKLHGK